MVYRLLGKPVPEIIAHCGKMGRFLLQCIPKKPAVCYIQPHLFRRPPEGWQPIQVLDQYHLEQHHWVYARSAIVLAVQWLHHLVQPAKIHCLVYFPQQMLLWHQAIYSYYLYYMTVHFPTFQHLFHHLLLILPLMNEKAQLLLDFFDRLRARPGPLAPGALFSLSRNPAMRQAYAGFGSCSGQRRRI